MTNAAYLAEEIKHRIKVVIGNPEGFIPLHEPEFRDQEEALVIDCIRSGWVSSVGKYVDQFEEDIAKACGTRHGIAVVNGTAALEVALRVAGVKGGDEVLMPSLTFIATANAAHHLGAIPHFVDVERQTLGLDPHAFRSYLEDIAIHYDDVWINKTTGRRLAAVVPMHTFGHPVDMDTLSMVAQDFGLIIVEDAAEALGSRYHNRQCGGLGRIAALSFNGNKILTTGGGGALVTDDPELAVRARHLTTTAKVTHPWSFIHDEIGYNYRMPNINAALGVAQLKQLDTRLAQKRTLAESYMASFKGHSGAQIMVEPDGSKANYWLNTLILEPHSSDARDTVLKTLNASQIMARPTWEPLHSLQIYNKCPCAPVPVTTELAARIINIPSSAHLGRT